MHLNQWDCPTARGFRDGAVYLPAPAMNEIKPFRAERGQRNAWPALQERSALIRGRCALLAAIVIIHAPQTSDLQRYGESPRWQRETGLHNPVSTIPCTNKRWVRSEHCDWVMDLRDLGSGGGQMSFWERRYTRFYLSLTRHKDEPCWFLIRGTGFIVQARWKHSCKFGGKSTG